MLPVLLFGGALILGIFASGCHSEPTEKKSEPPPDPETQGNEPSPAPSSSNFIEVTPSAIETAGSGPCARWVYGDHFLDRLKNDGLLSKGFACDPTDKFWYFDSSTLAFNLAKPQASDIERLKKNLHAAPRLADGSVDFSYLGVKRSLEPLFASKDSEAILAQIQKVAAQIKAQPDQNQNFTVLGHAAELPDPIFQTVGPNLASRRAEVVKELLVAYGVDSQRLTTAGSFHFTFMKEALPKGPLYDKLWQETRWVAILPKN